MVDWALAAVLYLLDKTRFEKASSFNAQRGVNERSGYVQQTSFVNQLGSAINRRRFSVVDWLTVHFRAIGVIMKLSLEGGTNLHASAVHP